MLNFQIFYIYIVNIIFIFFFLLMNSNKIIIRLKYGLYYYFFWIKVGCKNIKWKFFFTIYFLLEYVYNSLIAFSMYNYITTTLKYNYLPIRRSVFTLSKGPMVRKKKSREQFMFKQIFVNVKKIFHFLDRKFFLNRFKFELKNLHFIKFAKFIYLYKLFLNNCNFSSLFLLLNYNINFFNIFIKNMNNCNIFIETNIFYLKKIYIYINFNDIFYFQI